MDLVVLQEIKVMGGIYTWESEGYRVVSDNVTIPHHSGVTVLYHEVDHFAIAVLCLHGPNIASLQLVLGGAAGACSGELNCPG